MLNKKIALITGITGQDGSYMAELLLSKNYIVHGIIRRASNFNTKNIDHIFDKLILHYGDITDSMNVLEIIKRIEPDEVYSLGAQSQVRVSAELENYTLQTNTIGVLNVLQSVRFCGLEKTCKIYQADTSETYGNIGKNSILNEDSPRAPVSMYGISKLAATNICDMYKNAYGMFIVSSTLFNHESERRGPTFVTQKISNYVGKYKNNKCDKPLQLGNLDSSRDWGYSPDFMEAVYLMMQQETPNNFVIATGETHSVREFVEEAFKNIDVKIEWRGKGRDEYGINVANNEKLIEINPQYYRDIEIDCLIGDASKAKRILGWTPKTSFKKLVNLMVTNSIKKFN